jgi:transcriptional regulator with XRE-family HTH domain
MELTVRELAEKAGISHDTIVRIEGGQELKPGTVAKVRSAFEDLGIIFTDGKEPGIKIKAGGIALNAPSGTGKRTR